MKSKRCVLIGFIILLFCSYSTVNSQSSERPEITVQSSLVNGNVHLLYCVGGFGGGNVAASVGEDGVLLVDDMYAVMADKLGAHLKTISDKPVKMVLNTHFHRDHIEGNKILRKSAVIVAHENVEKQLIKNNKEQAPTAEMMPMVTFTDRIKIRFNGEDIIMIHFPNSHTDGDAAIYFTKSNVLHLGDMFFLGMFPAVYSAGGGDVKQLIKSLEKILLDIPSDAKVIPGHGDIATMKDLSDYVTMLKETTSIVEDAIKKGKSVETMKEQKILAKYDALGSGGAQTTDQYLAMLYKLLTEAK